MCYAGDKKKATAKPEISGVQCASTVGKFSSSSSCSSLPAAAGV